MESQTSNGSTGDKIIKNSKKAEMSEKVASNADQRLKNQRQIENNRSDEKESSNTFGQLEKQGPKSKKLKWK